MSSKYTITLPKYTITDLSFSNNGCNKEMAKLIYKYHHDTCKLIVEFTQLSLTVSEGSVPHLYDSYVAAIENLQQGLIDAGKLINYTIRFIKN